MRVHWLQANEIMTFLVSTAHNGRSRLPLTAAGVDGKGCTVSPFLISLPQPRGVDATNHRYHVYLYIT